MSRFRAFKSRIEIALPEWISAFSLEHPACPDDRAKMRLTNALARCNVERQTGGPFGAIVFDATTGEPVAFGVNSVARLNNSVLHAEVMALMLAQARLGHYSLCTEEPRLELFSSCEPCAMCLGAVLWSGVRRIVCAASYADATALGFDEGPVTPQSWDYLVARGVEVVRGVEAKGAREVMALYRKSRGLIYDPRGAKNPA
jgi:tRNA(Arg) A34 adenosine deaminase TadA